MPRDNTNVKQRRYRVLHRAPIALVIPATAVDFATFLATFTELGYCRDKSIKANITKGDEETLDDGSKVVLGYNGKLEGILSQSAVEDYTAVEAIENIPQDILLYAENSGVCIFFPNTLLYFEEAVTSGEVESIPFSYEVENLESKAAFRTRFVESVA